MPLVSKVVKIDNLSLSDGGTADSIPIRFLEQQGYNKNIVILTQPKGFVKKRNSFLPILRVALRKYPALLRTLSNRHITYNETLKYIETQQNAGNLFVIQPPEALNIGAVEHRPEELERVYQIGRHEAQRELQHIIRFLN